MKLIKIKNKDETIMKKMKKRKRCCDCIWADVSSGVAIICGRHCREKERYIHK